MLGPGDVERDWVDEACGDGVASASVLVVEPALRRLKKPMLSAGQLHSPRTVCCSKREVSEMDGCEDRAQTHFRATKESRCKVERTGNEAKFFGGRRSGTAQCGAQRDQASPG